MSRNPWAQHGWAQLQNEAREERVAMDDLVQRIVQRCGPEAVRIAFAAADAAERTAREARKVASATHYAAEWKLRATRAAQESWDHADYARGNAHLAAERAAARDPEPGPMSALPIRVEWAIDHAAYGAARAAEAMEDGESARAAYRRFIRRMVKAVAVAAA